MTPVDQEFLSDPSNGLFGDCVRAATASILDLPNSLVPHFVQLFDHYWQASWEIWLADRGLAAIGLGKIVMHDLEPPDCFYLASGPAARGTDHMLVMRAGKVAHDPHPSRAGLISTRMIWLLTPIDIGGMLRADEAW